MSAAEDALWVVNDHDYLFVNHSQQALEVLMAGPAFSRVMETKGEKMLSRDFTPEARLAQHHKDVKLILEEAAHANLTLPLSILHEELLARLVAVGNGDLDNSAILKAFE